MGGIDSRDQQKILRWEENKTDIKVDFCFYIFFGYVVDVGDGIVFTPDIICMVASNFCSLSSPGRLTL